MTGTCFHADLSRVQLCARLTSLMACARMLASQAEVDGFPEGTAAEAVEREIVMIEDEIYTRDLSDGEPFSDVAERREFNRVARLAFGIRREQAA